LLRCKKVSSNTAKATALYHSSANWFLNKPKAKHISNTVTPKSFPVFYLYQF